MNFKEKIEFLKYDITVESEIVRLYTDFEKWRKNHPNISQLESELGLDRTSMLGINIDHELMHYYLNECIKSKNDINFKEKAKSLGYDVTDVNEILRFEKDFEEWVQKTCHPSIQNDRNSVYALDIEKELRKAFMDELSINHT